LTVGKISKTGANTSCQVLRPNCTKFDFAGTPPQNPLGDPTALSNWVLWIQQRRSGGKEKGKEVSLGWRVQAVPLYAPT